MTKHNFSAMEKADLLASLRARAEAQMSAYPQYRGHSERYSLALILKTQKRKLGVAFAQGELALVDPKGEPIEFGPLAGKEIHFGWSMLNRIATSISLKDVRFL